MNPRNIVSTRRSHCSYGERNNDKVKGSLYNSSTSFSKFKCLRFLLTECKKIYNINKPRNLWERKHINHQEISNISPEILIETMDSAVGREQICIGNAGDHLGDMISKNVHHVRFLYELYLIKCYLISLAQIVYVFFIL